MCHHLSVDEQTYTQVYPVSFYQQQTSSHSSLSAPSLGFNPAVILITNLYIYVNINVYQPQKINFFPLCKSVIATTLLTQERRSFFFFSELPTCAHIDSLKVSLYTFDYLLCFHNIPCTVASTQINTVSCLRGPSTNEGIFRVGFKHNLLPWKWIIFITLIKLFYSIQTFFIFSNVFYCCFFLITHRKF